eukprot:6179822-Pleurochrysis_carterae.AAC.2
MNGFYHTFRSQDDKSVQHFKAIYIDRVFKKGSVVQYRDARNGAKARRDDVDSQSFEAALCTVHQSLHPQLPLPLPVKSVGHAHQTL